MTQYLPFSVPSLQNITRINDIVKQALLVFPHFCLGRGLMDMAKNQAMATLYQNLGKMFTLRARSWDLRGKLMCVCLFRWRPLRKSSQLEHGGQESVCHGHSGGRHVRPDAAHPVQVLLQTHVRNTHLNGIVNPKTNMCYSFSGHPRCRWLCSSAEQWIRLLAETVVIGDS